MLSRQRCMMTNEAQRTQWNNPGFVDFWKRMEPSAISVSDALMNALAPAAGESIVDIGCGGGLTTLAVGDAVGPTGKGTGVDISGPLLAIARDRAKETGIANVSFIELDAQADAYPGAPFDAAMSRLGVMFFDNPPEAFANIRKHLKPGARLAFVCFQSPMANPWFPFPVLMKYAPTGGPERKFPPPSPFALGDEGFVRGVLSGSGWTDIALSPLSASGQSWGGAAGADAARAMLNEFDLSEKTMAQALAEVQRYNESLAPATVDSLERKFWVVTAKNPG